MLKTEKNGVVIEFYLYICKSSVCINQFINNQKNELTMEKYSKIIQGAFIAVGLLLLGLCIKGGFDNFTNKDRRVTVKGLAEKQVKSDHVTWTFTVTYVGNDINTMSHSVDRELGIIQTWLKEKGVTASDTMSVGAPSFTDNEDNYTYEDKKPKYRYSLSKTLTIVSKRTKEISDIIAAKGELFGRGVYYYSDYAYFEFTQFAQLKPEMMQIAIANAEKTAQQFAENSHSQINKIVEAGQGEFSIDSGDKDYLKKVRVVSTITYSLKD